MRIRSRYKGKFVPKNPEKYIGDVENVIYRSGWELKFMNYLDAHTAIKRWSSEEKVIPYFDPTRRKMRRYFPDFYVEFIDVNKTLQKWIVEIKPAAQVASPSKPTKTTKNARKRFLYESFVYAVNNAKWQAAEAYCKKHGFQFKILTEHELAIK